jgi:pyruvate dehydrogenase E1 component alpha subunit
VFELPVLFVCEDNGFAATTRTRAMTAGEGPSARARSFGIPAVEIDGNDVVAVDATARELVDAVRSGAGPRFLHAHTYRLTGHTAADLAPYRPKDEVEARWQQDPIGRAAEMLGQAGLPAHETEADRAAAEAEMAAVYREAADTPFPPDSRAFADVQNDGDPRQVAF